MEVFIYIKVGGFTYNVERPSNPFPSDNTVCDGDHNFANKTIRVAANGSPAYQDMVFVHELCHAIIAYYTPKLEQDEKFVEQFSKGLYQVMVDNQEWFQGGAGE